MNRIISFLHLIFAMLFLIFISCSSQKEDSESTNKLESSFSKDSSSLQNKSATIQEQTSAYGFETGTEGWLFQTWEDTKGISRIEQTEAYSKSGHFSLHLSCDIDGISPTNSKGEAFVDLRTSPPAGVEAPVNLKDKKITCWIFVPSNKAVGDPHRPNGITLFVKSIKNEGMQNEQWAAQYGTWYNLTGRTGSWFEINLKPSIETPRLGFTQDGFDPTSIVVVGVKIAAGTGSSASFKGSIFIDELDW